MNSTLYFFSLLDFLFQLNALSRSDYNIVREIGSREHILVLILDIPFQLDLFRH